MIDVIASNMRNFVEKISAFTLDHDSRWWVSLGMVTVVALLGLMAGIFVSAMNGLSRTRLQELANRHIASRKSGRFAGMLGKSLQWVLNEPELTRLCGSLLQSLANGAMVIYLTVYWVFNYNNPEMAVPVGDVVFKVVCVLLLLGVLRVLASVLGRIEEEWLVLMLARPVGYLSFPLRPVVHVVTAMGNALIRGFGGSTEKTEEEREEEILNMVNDSEDTGIKKEQITMIHAIMDFKDTDVADVFTPRIDMVTIDITTSLEDAINKSICTGYSRLPVHQDTRDNIVGIFNVRDVLQYWGKDQSTVPQLKDIIRTPLFVPETKKIPELLGELKHGRSHIAVVLDEYGGTAGLVTIEDVLEEIVGDITDEYDPKEVKNQLRKLSDCEFEVDGTIHVSEVNDALGNDIIPEDDDYETIGGFVLHTLGHIPATGEQVTYEDSLQVKVLEADDRKVHRVKITNLMQTPVTEESEIN